MEPRKLYIELPYDPAIPLLGIYPDKTLLKKNTRTRMFIAALFTIAKTCKQPKCPLTDDWIVVYIHKGILLSHKTERNNAICSNMDGTRDSHTKCAQKRNSWTWRIDLWLSRGRGKEWDGLGAWG